MFPVNLTKEQIRNSPDIDTHKPVSRQLELQLYGHYPWQSYWGSGFYPGGVWGITDQPPTINRAITEEAGFVHKESGDDVHLRSTHLVAGYHIQGTDGKIGHVTDFIMDDQTWKIIYLVVTTHAYFGGKKVLIGGTHVTKIEWSNSEILVDLSVAAIGKSEMFDHAAFIDAETAEAAREKHRIHLK